MTTRYLRTYPIPWPVFSVKYYTLDSDGWWNPKPRRRRNKRQNLEFPVFN